jgi:hypothetical protein
MSAFPYAEIAYVGALPIPTPASVYNAYNTGAFISYPYAANPSYHPSATHAYPSTTSYPTYAFLPAAYTVSASSSAPAAIPEIKNEKTAIKHQILSDVSSLKHYRNHARIVEESVVAAYQELEREHVAMNQKQSKDYENVYHRETQELVKFLQKFESVENQLPRDIVEEANKRNIFPRPIIPRPRYPAQEHQVQAGAPISSPAAETTRSAIKDRKHPMLELKDLQDNARELRKLLQGRVDAQLTTV